MISKNVPGFRERGATGGSCKQLDAQFRFKPDQPPADDRLRNAEPPRGGRDAPGICNFDECNQVFNVQFGVPHFATQLGGIGRYRITNGNDKCLGTASQSAHVSPQQRIYS